MYIYNLDLISSSDFLRKVSTWYDRLHNMIFILSKILWLQMRATTFKEMSHLTNLARRCLIGAHN